MLNTRSIQLAIKCVIDIIAAAVGLAVLFPVFVLIAAAIKLTSRGPVFFLQDRVGMEGKIFKLFKFRTMVPGAAKMGRGLGVTPRDPRITRTGAILRKMSLDELPQLVNVLKGDISLIGPRPTVPEHLAYYGDFEYRRLEVKPGITGLAMVRCRGSMPWSVRIKYDVEYIDKFNLWLDCKILAETLWVVLARKNIYYDYEKHGPAFDLVKPSEKSDADKQENTKDINQTGDSNGRR